MGAFFIYILKSSVCLVLFYLFFRLLLSKETFHRFNRIALLGVLLISLLIPFIEITTKHQVEMQQAVLTIEQLLIMAEAQASAGITGELTQKTISISWIQFVLLAYLTGIVFLVCRNIYSLIRLLRLIRSGRPEKLEDGIILVVHEREIAPFSWMKYIVIRQKDLAENGREILIHEMAHIRHRHSIDLLLADICIFFQWFNPGVWLLKQELQNIHEYEADEVVINEGVNAKEYQLLLIKKAVGTRLYSMVNSFNHSKLKKRITMMLKEKSSPWARLKYLYVLPLAAVAVTAFARPEISKKVEEISAVKVNDLTSIVEVKSDENVVKVLDDTVKNKVVMKVYPTIKKDSVRVVIKENVTTALTVTGYKKDNPLVFINGKESDVAVLNALNPEYIESMTVIDAEHALKEYGKRGKRGVFNVQLYSEEKFNPQKITPDVKIKLRSLNEGSKNWGATFYSTTEEKPLIIIDGKEVQGNDPLSALSPDRIKSISVLKDKASQTAYGDKGKNGVILVDMLTEDEYQSNQKKKKVVSGNIHIDTTKADSVTVIRESR